MTVSEGVTRHERAMKFNLSTYVTNRDKMANDTYLYLKLVFVLFYFLYENVKFISTFNSNCVLWFLTSFPFI